MAPNITSSNTYYSPEHHSREDYPLYGQEVRHAYFLLRQRLPHELAVNVLDLAKYWTRSRHFMVRSVSPKSDGPQETTRAKPECRIILYTSPLNEPSCQGIKRAVFTIRSHDQGWSERLVDSGDLGAWPWSETYVRSPHDDERPACLLPPPHDRVSPSVWSWKRSCLITNSCVMFDASEKTVEWRWDADDAEERRIVRSVGTGCSIVLTAHACFYG